MRPLLHLIVGIAAILLSGSRPAQGAQGLRIELKDFTQDGRTAPGWTAWAQRDEIQPRCYVDSTHFRSAPDALAISGDGNPLEYGGWAHVIGDIKPGSSTGSPPTSARSPSPTR